MKYTCAYCQKHSCHKNDLKDAPKNCPTKNESDEMEKILEEYSKKENYDIAKASESILKNS